MHRDACTINELASDQVSAKSCLSSIACNSSLSLSPLSCFLSFSLRPTLCTGLVCIRGHEKIVARTPRANCRACYFHGIHSTWSIRRRPWHLPCRGNHPPPPRQESFRAAVPPRGTLFKALSQSSRKFLELKFYPVPFINVFTLARFVDNPNVGKVNVANGDFQVEEKLRVLSGLRTSAWSFQRSTK